MLGLKEPCLKLIFKLGLVSYTFLFIFLTFLFSNWRIGAGSCDSDSSFLCPALLLVVVLPEAWGAVRGTV